MSNPAGQLPDETPPQLQPGDMRPGGTAPEGAAPNGTAPDETAPDGTVSESTAPQGIRTPPDGSLLDGEQLAGDDTVTIHRSPRYFRFMAAGAVLGVLIAVVLTFAFPEPPGFNPAQIFGFLGILFVIVGVAVGAIVALLIDRVSRRRARTVAVERIESAPPE